MSKTKKQDQPTYGDAASRLEEILEKIEEGEVDIDELSGLVREAAELVKLCREKIRAAETQVRTVTEQLEREAGDEAQEPEPGGAVAGGGSEIPLDPRD